MACGNSLSRFSASVGEERHCQPGSPRRRVGQHFSAPKLLADIRIAIIHEDPSFLYA
jgi:hypothetical protein